MKLKSTLIDEGAFRRTLSRIAHEIIEKNESVDDICLIGIKTRGVPLAERISARIGEIENVQIPVGTLDITLHRDDLDRTRHKDAVVSSSHIPFDVSGKNIILVDDVIYTGRSVRAALDAVMSYGRPSKIQLAVFVDRGHRELPIRPDYVGKNIPTSRNEIVRVRLSENDSADGVDIYEK